MRKPAKMTAKKQDEAEIHPGFMLVVDAFAGDPNVSRKKMFSSNSVLNVNGKIFAMVVKDKFVVKLPNQRVDELVSGGKGEYFDPGHGRLMKEWVAVGEEMPAWVELAREAYRFVRKGKP